MLTEVEKQKIIIRATEVYTGRTKKAGMNGVVVRKQRLAFIAGATEERERAKVLAEALESLQKWDEEKLSWKDAHVRLQAVVKQALSSYNLK